DAYPASRWEFILALMRDESLGLCFPVEAGTAESFLVPEALPVNEPFYGNWPADSLRFRYAYELLPRGLLPRFIVQAHHRLTEPPRAGAAGSCSAPRSEPCSCARISSNDGSTSWSTARAGCSARR